MHFLSVAQSKYMAKPRQQFARRIEEERPPLARSRITDDWFVLLDVASGESGILFTNLPVAFFAGRLTRVMLLSLPLFSGDTHVLCRARLRMEGVVCGFVLTFPCGLTSDFASPSDPSWSSLLVSFALVPLPLWSFCSRRTSGPRSLPG